VPRPDDRLTIGELATRAGVSTPTLRFYEAEGLLSSERTTGGQRRYVRSSLRRIAFIRSAQRLGLSLGEIRATLASLPAGRTPTRADWTRLSRQWRRRIDERISELETLRDRLDGCVGCGCLSLRRCTLYNPAARAAAAGSGARYLVGDDPPDAPPPTSPRRQGG